MKCIINNAFVVDFEHGTVLSNETGLRTTLGSNEAKLLSVFFERPRHVFTRKDLIDIVWTSRGIVVEDSSLMQSISLLRRAFEDKKGQIVKTERGVGYTFLGDVEEQTDLPEDKPKPISFHWRLCLFAFLGLGLFSYFVASLISSRYEDAEKYLEGKFSICELSLPEGDKVERYTNVALYHIKGVIILIDDDGKSISFPDTYKEYRCE